MRTLKVLLIFMAAASLTFAQSVGNWKIYSDQKNINASFATQTGIWSATNGGAFYFNFSDSSFTTVTKADGLNSQALTATGIDNTNRIWFGSQEGYLNILDSQNNSINMIIDIFNSNKSRKQINNLFIKGDSVLVSSDFGLSLVSTKTLSFLDSFLKLGNFAAETKVISAYKSKLIYAITTSGVAVQKQDAQNLLAPESWDTYNFNSNIDADSASQILEFNGQVLLASSKGIYRFTNKTWQLFAFQGNGIIKMFVSGNDLYALAKNELFKYSNGQTTSLFKNTNFNFNSVSVANQTIYISSDKGLIELKNGKIKVRIPNGPASNSFVNMSVDPAGRLWIATGKDAFGAGFMKFDRTAWQIFNITNTPELPTNAYYNVYAASDSTIYLSNWGYGLTIYKNGKFTVYQASNSELVGFKDDPKFIPIADCKVDSKGNPWILSTMNVSRRSLSTLTKQNKWYHFSVAGLSEFDNIDKLVIDQYDTKWFAVTIQGRFGLFYFNENKTYDIATDDFQGYISSADGLLSDLVSALAIDKRGYLWIGTNIGLNVILEPSKPKVVSNLGLALRNQAISCIAVDPLDQKWIGTKQGVFVISSDGIQLVAQYSSKNSPLPSDDIKSIAVDAKNGIVYIGTDYGLASLQTSAIQPQQSFSNLFVYPNPFIAGDGKSLTIDGLIKNSSIKIFNINGNLIRVFRSPGGKIAFWDGKDDNGNDVSSGIYILTAYDDEANNVTSSKVAVIRK